MSAIAEPNRTYGDRDGYAGTVRDNVISSRSAVSWGAVFAGAAAAAALSLILLLLGTGLGLSSVSPWASEGVDASTFGVSSIIWITFMQLAASAVGGYLAGRLRTKWTGVHNDEVYERAIDTQIGRLRRRLEEYGDGRELIRTERGAGYAFTVPVEAVR